MTCSKRTLWCKTPILTQFYVSVGWSYYFNTVLLFEQGYKLYLR